MNKLPKTILLAILVLISTGLVMLGCSTQSTEVDNRNSAPDFQFYDPEEKPVFLSDLRGKTVMLNFWATWCGPCVYEMPYLQQVYQEWSDKGLVLLAINMGESSSRVNAFLQRYSVSFPVLLDPGQEVALKYNVSYIPTTFFIDKEGFIQAVKVGPFPNKKAIEDELNKIMH